MILKLWTTFRASVPLNECMDRLADEFEAYVRARTPALLRSAYLLTCDPQRAEDLVQEALIRTHRAWRRLHDGNPDAYTRKVMYHLQISWWRRARAIEVPLDDLPESQMRWRLHDSHDTRIALKAALTRLTPKQRAVIVLRFFEDLTEVDTAALLGVTVGTVKSQTAKALARLRSITHQFEEVKP
jgi:RNA polymerase sigma-70 factor (sigma-E family)